MRGFIDYTGDIWGIPDLIYEYGIIHDNNPNSVWLPDDFSYDRYDYIPQISGIYDPNGFILKTNET